MNAWRRLLFPLSFFYGIVVRLRNLFYDRGLLRSERFEVKTIGVGNLTVGGTGKTPHVEYLVRLLRKRLQVATLSRGYGRSTKGFLLASTPCNAKMIGDEPMQYYSKFDDITVAVGENRAEAIRQLLNMSPRPEAIVLDDNFQHRKVKVDLQILLLNYENLEKHDLLLPAGDLREPESGADRADIVIVSKTPSILVPIERKRILGIVQPREGQPVFFTYYRYGEFHRLHGKENVGMMMGAGYYLEKRFTILLVAGIANPSGLIEYLRRHTNKLETLVFPDHHSYDEKDLQKIKDTFEDIVNPNKIIVTTEKDAMRFRQPDIEPMVRQLPFFYVPIEVAFHQDGDTFDRIILEHVGKNNQHR
ncbi:MAG: tetraacyldisaccharide 4'-kinase [Bacteroidota bacterium]